MFRFIRELAVIAVLTVCGASFSLFSGLMPLPWEEPDLAAGEIQLADARVLNVIWVDARSRADHDAGHIPGATLLNNSNWDAGIYDLMNVWLTDPRPIVVYCGSEQCGASKQIAQKLRDALQEAEVYSLKGGWEAWKKLNYRPLLVLVARLALTGTFVMAALPKIKDPVAFSASVNAFQLVGPELSNWIALFLPWLELILGIGILLPQIRTSSGMLIAALLIVFIGLHASAWMRGLEISCGCFGTEFTGEPTNYPFLITRNAILLVACCLVISKDRINKSHGFD